MPRQQHAVAENIARHVADAHDREFGALRVDAHLPKVALDALPGAARGDAHGLVVVADAAARGERIAKPVTVFSADRVGVVRKCGGALVGGDDEIRVVAVQPNHLRRWHHGAGDEVVGQVEQAAQVILVAGHAFFHESLAVRCGWRFFQHEPALRPDRHDDGVLHLLRLDEAEHFGSKVVWPVGPAQPTARDLAAAQVDAFKPW